MLMDLNDFIPPTFLLKGGLSGAKAEDSERERFAIYVRTAKPTIENCFGLEFPDHSELGDLSPGVGGEEVEEGKDGKEGEDVEGDGECGHGEGGDEEKKGSGSDDKNCETGALWIVKPAASTNRGCGIQVCEGYDQVIDVVSKKGKSKLNNRLTKRHGWVVQKYMERPFLIEGRKFDLRVYVLFTVNKGGKRPVNSYMYNEFYVRTSGVVYNTSRKGVKNTMMHLTNDAVQKKVKDNYGKHEMANKLSMADFGEYLTEKKGVGADYVESSLRPRLREIVRITAESVEAKLNKNGRKHGFELMGYDFMIDENLTPWLIEVNSNPCLEQPCPLLERLIGEVVESTFQIGVDRFFPPPKVQTKKCGEAVRAIEELKKGNKFELVVGEDS